MRLVLAMVFAGLVALPLSASAQAEESEEAPKHAVEQEPAPTSEPTPEEPALQLKLDDAGVEVAPSPPRTLDGYTLEQMERRVKRARTGLLVSGMSMLGGTVLLLAGGLEYADCAGSFGDCVVPSAAGPLMITGGVLMAGGFVGLVASGILKRNRKRDRDSLQQAAYATRRRVQWDLAQSRLVF
jgi:hypothetical protein